MPITQMVLNNYISDNFIETGTATGGTSLNALQIGFKEIWTVEKCDDRIKICENKFKDKKNIHFYAGDSRKFLKNILQYINGSVTFWLDAHTNSWSPLLEELAIIKENMEIVPIILIDDVSLFGAYKIKKKDVKKRLLNICPDYQISYENGKRNKGKKRKNDIMVAQIRRKDER